MRILRAHGVPGFCRGRLQGERHVSTWEGLGAGKPHSSLARRQSSQQFEMRCLQEKLFFCRVPFRVSLRVVRHDGKYFPSSFLNFCISFFFLSLHQFKSFRRILYFYVNENNVYVCAYISFISEVEINVVIPPFEAEMKKLKLFGNRWTMLNCFN